MDAMSKVVPRLGAKALNTMGLAFLGLSCPYLQPNSNGLQPKSDGLQPNSDGLDPNSLSCPSYA